MTANIEDIYELTSVQRGMLFHCIFAPESDAYQNRMSLELEGPLDVEAFTSAWSQVVKRNGVLRTAFVWEDLEKPMQVVLREVDWNLEIHDWSNRSPEDRSADLEALAARHKSQPFDLKRAPLMRAALVKVDQSHWRLVWTFHHIILEGWSASLVLQEVGALYSGFVSGSRPDLPERRPYRDYVTWLAGQDQKSAEEYWRNTFAGITGPLRLPIDRWRGTGPAPVLKSARVERELGAPATAALREFARSHRATVNTVLQAAWSIVLSRYCGERDAIFGTIVSGRPPQLGVADQMVGLFINLVPTRVTVNEDQSFADFIQELHREASRRLRFEHCAMADVQRWIGVPAGKSFLETLLDFENQPRYVPDRGWAEGLAVRGISVFDGTDHPITLVVLGQQNLRLALRYDSDRFELQAVQRLLGHLHNLLLEIAKNPARRVQELSMIPPEERRDLLVARQPPPKAFSCRSAIHHEFERRVELVSDADALIYENRKLSYAELNSRANRLAHHLRARGVGPEVLVGLCVERGTEMIIAVLGILKAGGAYLPLDPAHPPERLAFTFKDSQAALLLTQARFTHLFDVDPTRCVNLDPDEERIAQSNDTNPAGQSESSHLAYVMYTSGSTGRPKGVQITHGALMNFLCSMKEAPGLDPGDVLLSVTTLSFDIAGLELFLPLMVGAKIVLADSRSAGDGARLAELITRSRTTVLQATPATWEMLLHAEWKGHPRLKVLCGGEAMSRELADQLLQRSGEVWNMYGPTETTVWSTIHKVGRGSNSIPIGRPIANTQIYVLDPLLAPVPVGVPGELYIGGRGLARGYLNRPELTTERFIPSPFDSSPTKLYKTGDIVRYAENGELEYLGRFDHQVKLRGFRIELGEIECVLKEHDSIRQAVAVVRGDVPGDKRLVAYMVPAGPQPPTPADLRAFVGRKLSAPMQPSEYVFLESLPLTPNGKVNRAALPAPGGQRQVEDEYVAPRTELEERIAAIWKELLRVDRVGVHDNFFESGGHSLLAMQLTSRLCREFQLELNLDAMFQAPTVAGLSDLVLLKLLEEAGTSSSNFDNGSGDSLDSVRPRDRQDGFSTLQGERRG